MKIAISGSSGFIGKHLTSFFEERGEVVVHLTHSLFSDSNNEQLREALTGCDIVINLAGATINQRWTNEAKRKILDSRLDVTRKLVSIINESEIKPSLFISTSAVGIYPNDGVYTENNASEGVGFLSEVCACWEDEAQKLSPDVRLVIIRLGVVLATDGGALPKMALPFRLFIGGKIASGEQGFSWIHIEDVLYGILHLIHHPELSGVVNMVSPQPTVNYLFTEELAAVLHRPAWFTVPVFALRFLYGEGEVMMTEGQQAYPARLLSSGYTFRFGELHLALRNLFL